MTFSTKNTASSRQSRTSACVFRVTKLAKLNVQTHMSKHKLGAIEDHIYEQRKERASQSAPSACTKKRRRDTVESDAENEAEPRPQKALKKFQPKIFILTPPASSPEPEKASPTLVELKAIHRSFVQALAVHYAHHGTTSAVPLSALLPSMTRLWRRRTVELQDIQRMLAIWELGRDHVDTAVTHDKGPCRLVTTGVASNQMTKIEYVWTDMTCTFLETQLHKRYEQKIDALLASAQCDSKSVHSWVFGSLDQCPSLVCQIGVQTQARKQKISTIRDSILSKSTTQSSPSTTQTDPDFSALTISEPSDISVAKTTREDKLKSRTLGLFDRLRAKQLANNASGAQPTSAEHLRRRALHRIPEIIDVLRLKQSQKLNSLFRADVHSISGGCRSSSMKVSFSIEQLVQEIKDSGRMAIAAEEIRACLNILGCDVPDTWCSIYVGEGNTVQCVTLQGEGWKKDEIRQWCQKEIAAMTSKI